MISNNRNSLPVDKAIFFGSLSIVTVCPAISVIVTEKVFTTLENESDEVTMKEKIINRVRE
jgi:quinolinate synthase